MILEVAVTTADEAAVAVRAGADRLELGSALEIGGLTPSPGTFLEVRAAVAVPVYVLLRPRPGGFEYTAAERRSMLRDADWFLSNGGDGVVVGPLTLGVIDSNSCRDVVKRAEGRCVFHRAFDFLPDPPAALEELIDLGFERVLTSGGAATAADGREQLAALIRQAGRRIEVLPAGGIRPENVAELVRVTGCDQVHTSARSVILDPTRSANPRLAAQMGERFRTDAGIVARVRAVLDRDLK